MEATGRNTWAPVAVVTSLFFMWGFITVLVDSLIPRLREIFELSYFEAGLVQFAFFIAYLFVSIPSGWLLSRIGYKSGMLVGLATMGAGCLLFWPAAGLRLFPLFMLGYFILASGMTVLQVAANPYMAVLGEERGASSRLNLAQAFNSVGTTIAPIIGAHYILSDHIRSSADLASMDLASKENYYVQEAAAVQGPFVVLAGALLFLALIVGMVRLPRILDPHRTGTYSAALHKPGLLRGAFGIFLYVGAEVAIGSYLVNYFLSMDLAEVIRGDGTLSKIAATLLGGNLDAVDAKGVVGSFVALYWGGAMLGRFAGSLLTQLFKPALVLLVFASTAIVMVLISMNTTGTIAMWSILSVGLFNSVMFPTIFTQSIEGLGPLKPQASGILCTAIFGGAVIPPLLGLLADGFGFKIAFLLVVLCYGYITYFAWTERRAAA